MENKYNFKNTNYNSKICDYIKNNYKNKSNIDLANEINRKFNINLTVVNIEYLKRRIKLVDKFNFEPAVNTGRFKKGNIPFSKGKKWNDFISEEGQRKIRKNICFKKGNISHNCLPIGTERMRYSGKDDIGYLCVKLYNGKKNNNWVPKHIYLYEKVFGKVPKGHKVIFADGDRFNFDLDNLILIEAKEHLILNKKKLRFNDKNLTKSAVLTTRIKNKINKLEKQQFNEK